MEVVICIRKPVADTTAAQAFYNVVKNKCSAVPDVTLTGHITDYLPEWSPTNE